MQVVVIPKYIRRVKLSESRRTKYYELGKKIPKSAKYRDMSKYEYREIKGYKKRRFLVDKATGERVIANPRAAGTPNYVVINGQKIYNGEVAGPIRNKMMKEIKAFMAPFIAELDPITDFPIRINMEIHDVIKEDGYSFWDVDNRAWPYIKAFQDCLTGDRGNYRKIIEDDHMMYITQPPIPLFVPVSNSEDRKLVFTITKEEDKRILTQEDFYKTLQELRKNNGEA